MNELDEEIKRFGRLFMNRLNNEMLQDAIKYVDYGERGLAFETICDHLSEYDVPIIFGEYTFAIELCKKLQMDVNDISMNHLKTLVVD
ncbi:TPA: MafI family immunity protein [Enterobacter cloacae]